jgi:hypothetical protein
MRTKIRTVLCAGVILSLLSASRPAKAENERQEEWKENHPRQHQVLHRANREQTRINHLYKEGKITSQQRDEMLERAKTIKQENHADSKANGGYITKDQQKVMNKQANQLNKEIRKQDANPAGATP